MFPWFSGHSNDDKKNFLYMRWLAKYNEMCESDSLIIIYWYSCAVFFFVFRYICVTCPEGIFITHDTQNVHVSRWWFGLNLCEELISLTSSSLVKLVAFASKICDEHQIKPHKDIMFPWWHTMVMTCLVCVLQGKSVGYKKLMGYFSFYLDVQIDKDKEISDKCYE